MDEIEKMLRRQKYQINIGVTLNDEAYILNTLIIKDHNIYITPHTQVHRSYDGNIQIKKGTSLYKLQPPQQEELPKFLPRPIHISLHQFKRIHAKSGNEYLSPRGHADLLGSKGVADVYLFIPGNPFKNIMKQRHKNKYCYVVDLPEDFDYTKKAIEFKLGVAAKNADQKQVAIYQKLSHQGTKFEFDFFDLYLSFRVVGPEQRGLHMVIYKEAPSERIIIDG